jgi:hypothetical protein
VFHLSLPTVSKSRHVCRSPNSITACIYSPALLKGRVAVSPTFAEKLLFSTLALARIVGCRSPNLPCTRSRQPCVSDTRESRKAHRQNEREYDSCTPVKIHLPREVRLILHGHVLSRSGHDPMSDPFQLSTLAGLLLTRRGGIGGHVVATSPMVHFTDSCLLSVFWPFQNYSHSPCASRNCTRHATVNRNSKRDDCSLSSCSDPHRTAAIVRLDDADGFGDSVDRDS